MAIGGRKRIHPKVAGAGIGASVMTFIIACVRWGGLEVPDDVATSATGLVATAGAWLAKENNT